jgi:hypothetical protein
MYAKRSMHGTCTQALEQAAKDRFAFAKALSLKDRVPIVRSTYIHFSFLGSVAAAAASGAAAPLPLLLAAAAVGAPAISFAASASGSSAENLHAVHNTSPLCMRSA